MFGSGFLKKNNKLRYKTSHLGNNQLFLLAYLFLFFEIQSLIPHYPVCLHLPHSENKKQKSDAEEDGGTVSQEEEDRKPKAEEDEILNRSPRNRKPRRE
ncbi:hypothetical protein H8959_022093 [Pygathrix nigripes]